ncbi:MAG: tetratricopeptide repeat protein [Arenicella sp.]
MSLIKFTQGEKTSLPVFLKILLLCSAVLVVYLPSTQNGFIWDDDHHVGKAPEFYADGLAAGLKEIWLNPLATAQYYPVVWSSFLLEHHFWQQNPLGYHIVNILLHIAVAILLWLVLCHLGVPWPFAVAALFALHPVNVESVAWVSERKNVLSGLFYMASMLTFLKWHCKKQINAPNQSNVFYFLSALLFMLALGSKTITATLPFVIMLLLWWKHSLDRMVFLRLVPFILAGVGMGCLTIWMEQGHAGAIGEAWDLSFVERSLIAGRAIWFYSEKLILPLNLTFIYPRWQIDPSVLWQSLFPLGVFIVVLLLWANREKIGRGPLAAFLIYCGTLFPALGFLNVFPMQFSFVADHFQYLASAAMLALLVSVVHRLAFRLDKRIAGLAFLAMIVFYAINSWGLQAQYKNQTTLWLATIDKNPNAWIAHGNLGAMYLNEKRYPEAIESLSKAIELNPKHIIPFNNLARLYLNLAKTYTQTEQEKNSKHLEQALSYGMRAIELGDAEREYFITKRIKPRVAQDHLDSHLIVGDARRHQGHNDAAKANYEAVLSLSRHNTDAFNRLGALALGSKDNLKALKFFKKSLSVKPGQFDSLYNLGVVHYRLGQLQQAEAALNQALLFGASEGFVLPHYYLGLIDLKQGRLEPASDHFEIVAMKMPQHAIGHKALDQMLNIEMN